MTRDLTRWPKLRPNKPERLVVPCKCGRERAIVDGKVMKCECGEEGE